jgi:ABC-2 type transport system ATP-binding protein
VRTYSGGMRRRLDLAANLMERPEVIVLDEPTIGLDPTSRLNLWQIVQTLARDGGTVLLTTQSLDEADHLADLIVVLCEGRVVASGPSADLKAQVGKRTVTVKLATEDIQAAVAALQRAGLQPMCDEQHKRVTVPVTASRDVAVVVRALDGVEVEADELALTEQSLDEVYVVVTRRTGTVGG